MLHVCILSLTWLHVCILSLTWIWLHVCILSLTWIWLHVCILSLTWLIFTYYHSHGVVLHVCNLSLKWLHICILSAHMAPCLHLITHIDLAPCLHIITHMDLAPCLHIINHMAPCLDILSCGYGHGLHVCIYHHSHGSGSMFAYYHSHGSGSMLHIITHMDHKHGYIKTRTHRKNIPCSKNCYSSQANGHGYISI